MNQPKPILQSVEASRAAAFSPWPNRIAGTESWLKPRRSSQEIQAEYEHGWYSDLLTRWTLFSARLAPHQRHPGSVLWFLDDVRRSNNDIMAANPAVYGQVDLEQYLVSAADRLYLADVNLFEILSRSFVTERAARVRSTIPFDQVVEVGCGGGVNLFNLYLRLGLTEVAGCERSHNAVQFLQRICDDLGIRGHFEQGDYRRTELIRSLAPKSGAWALLSVHTIEQLSDLTVDWFAEWVRLENAPRVAMHFEPLQWEDQTPFGRDCARYAELNRYNHSFLETAREAESAGLIQITWLEKRAIGLSAYNPTSVLMWVPVSH
jgi:hypothetical protein